MFSVRDISNPPSDKATASQLQPTRVSSFSPRPPVPLCCASGVVPSPCLALCGWWCVPVRLSCRPPYPGGHHKHDDMLCVLMPSVRRRATSWECACLPFLSLLPIRRLSGKGNAARIQWGSKGYRTQIAISQIAISVSSILSLYC